GPCSRGPCPSRPRRRAASERFPRLGPSSASRIPYLKQRRGDRTPQRATEPSAFDGRIQARRVMVHVGPPPRQHLSGIHLHTVRRTHHATHVFLFFRPSATCTSPHGQRSTLAYTDYGSGVPGGSSPR